MSTPFKPLVLCADDYAQHAGVTQAVLALARQGRLTATSAMVLSPRWRADAAPLRELRARLDVGLHLDFTSDFAIAAGHGLSLGAALRRALLGGFDAEAARGVIERQLDAFAHVQFRSGDQVLDLLGGLRRTLRQLSDFLGDDGKALAGLARPSSLYTGVERQQIGLKRNLIDDTDDLGDFAGRALYTFHCGNRLLHHFARFGSVTTGIGH